MGRANKRRRPQTEFKDRGIVLPESSDHEADGRVFALLINAEGDPFVTKDGVLAVVAVPVFGMEIRPDPEKPLSYKDVAKLIGVSLPTVKRMVGDGRLPKPSKVGQRRVVFRRSDVQLAIARLAG